MSAPDNGIAMELTWSGQRGRGKPRKRDFTDMREFLRASAEWATLNMSEWPWGGPKDEDDEYYFTAVYGRTEGRPAHQAPKDNYSETDEGSGKLD